MHTHLSFVISGLCLLLLSTGCGQSTTLVSANRANATPSATRAARARPPTIVAQPFAPEVFDAMSLAGVGPGMIAIDAELPADITIVAFPPDEVALDYQLAAAEAHNNIAISLERVAGGAQISVRSHDPAAMANDTIKLQVRVPRGASLHINAKAGGNVTVSGEVVDVTIFTASGAIAVDGVIGSAYLKTDDGSINAAALAQPQPHPAQQLELRALNGNLNLIAVGAHILATTTEGNIHFMGSLNGNDNSFSTTGKGRVLVALPSDLTYRFDIESRQRVVNDFMPTALVCAMAQSTDTQISTAPSPDLIGQLEASDPVMTTTYSVLSVVGRYRPGNQPERPYLYFVDNHSRLKRFSPEGNTPVNAAQAFWLPDCETVKQQVEQNTPPSAAGVRISAEDGEVLLRLIRKH